MRYRDIELTEEVVEEHDLVWLSVLVKDWARFQSWKSSLPAPNCLEGEGYAEESY